MIGDFLDRNKKPLSSKKWSTYRSQQGSISTRLLHPVYPSTEGRVFCCPDNNPQMP